MTLHACNDDNARLTTVPLKLYLIKNNYAEEIAVFLLLNPKHFMNCRLEKFSMDFILYYVNLSICKNK